MYQPSILSPFRLFLLPLVWQTSIAIVSILILVKALKSLFQLLNSRRNRQFLPFNIRPNHQLLHCDHRFCLMILRLQLIVGWKPLFMLLHLRLPLVQILKL
ncbi:hypothetical protein PCASD_09632 [Puccinia coronata f. sp. avenae]|uniref:Uncharacterized protein n=1 Tax=Puccinia coronata f. sp. avenae TaxID=200324 RepID=A0A2N5UPQ0_9BASI|nr:hypothetical protein PCASD_09632 [Puccinia coronata f. sp. avenae]